MCSWVSWWCQDTTPEMSYIIFHNLIPFTCGEFTSQMKGAWGRTFFKKANRNLTRGRETILENTLWSVFWTLVLKCFIDSAHIFSFVIICAIKSVWIPYSNAHIEWCRDLRSRKGHRVFQHISKKWQTPGDGEGPGPGKLQSTGLVKCWTRLGDKAATLSAHPNVVDSLQTAQSHCPRGITDFLLYNADGSPLSPLCCESDAAASVRHWTAWAAMPVKTNGKWNWPAGLTCTSQTYFPSYFLCNILKQPLYSLTFKW